MAEESSRRVVWTSDGDRATSVRYCQKCGRPAHTGRCDAGGADMARSGGVDTGRAAPRVTPRAGEVRVWLDRKRRRGHPVTIVAGLPGDDAELAALAQSLKRLCGSGGTARNGSVEIQGDHADKLVAHLRTLGYTAKRAGG